MCDTIVVVGQDGVLFAKNSDRDPNEAQIPEWHPAADHPSTATVQCTYLEIPQVSHTHAVLISRPYWMWGAEMGTNEHGVTIGNEAVFTDQPYADTGLTGMDLLRLALERATTADEAAGVIIDLLERHGQGGGCGHEDRSFTYHNSFLIADPAGAIVLETAGKLWATERVHAGVRAISNGLTIADFAAAHRDRLRTRVAACDLRIAFTSRNAAAAAGPADLMRILRSHGADEWPRYRAVNGTLRMPCMHGGGMAASSSSTAGWVSDLAADRHWITATSAQCLSLFKPVTVGEPVALAPVPDDHDDENSLWWRHERMARMVMRNPAVLAPVLMPERDRIEAAWLAELPSSAEAFDVHMEAIARWSEAVAAQRDGTDVRPWWARRYWSKRELAAV
jgi:dipeptidase